MCPFYCILFVLLVFYFVTLHKALLNCSKFLFSLGNDFWVLGFEASHTPASFAWAYLCKDAGLPPKVSTLLLVKDLRFIIYLHICCGCNTELAMVAGIQKWARNPVSFWNDNSSYSFIVKLYLLAYRRERRQVWSV